MRLQNSLILIVLFMVETNAFVSNKINYQSSTKLLARKPFITGNWKLNPQTRQEAIELATGVADAIKSNSQADVAIFVPFPFLDAVQSAVGSKLIVGAEMVTPKESGAFTGGVSPQMLKSIGINWSLVGHSERRTLFNENDESMNEQCKILIKNNMNIVLCIGETLEEFEKNLVGAVCEKQLKKGLAGISSDDMSKITIAYEPVWAIGTGKVATPEIAQSVHSICRNILNEMYGDNIAENTRILYGGSVSPESIDDLITKPDIDGVLVGGASLNADSFGRIINFTTENKQSTIGSIKEKILSVFAA